VGGKQRRLTGKEEFFSFPERGSRNLSNIPAGNQPCLMFPAGFFRFFPLMIWYFFLSPGASHSGGSRPASCIFRNILL
jgi:hypothetical protein